MPRENEMALEEAEYSAESALRHPGALAVAMWRDLKNSRELAWRLLVRNVSAQYRQSILGYLWAFLPPIATTATFLFLNSQGIMKVGETGIPYPAYVLVGTLLWQVFVDSLNSPIRLVTTSKAMLAKISFPREALILAGLGEVAFNFAVRGILLIGVFLWFGFSVPATMLLAPFGLLALSLVGVITGILLTPFAVLYQDVEKGLLLIVPIWFFVTPVVYPPPESWPGSLLSTFNPVSPILVTTREMLLTGSLSQPYEFVAYSAVATILLVLGWILYRVAMPHLIERMAA